VIHKNKAFSPCAYAPFVYTSDRTCTRHENAPHCRYGVATIRVNKEGEEANKSIYFFFLGEVPLYEKEGETKAKVLCLFRIWMPIKE